MKLQTFKKIILIMLLVVLGIAIYGAAALNPETALYKQLVVIDSIAMAVVIVILLVFGRCPHCGTHLYLRTFRLQKCPKCRKNLYGEVARKGRRLK